MFSRTGAASKQEGSEILATWQGYRYHAFLRINLKRRIKNEVFTCKEQLSLSMVPTRGAVTVVRFPTPVPVREVTPAVGRPVKYNY